MEAEKTTPATMIAKNLFNIVNSFFNYNFCQTPPAHSGLCWRVNEHKNRGDEERPRVWLFAYRVAVLGMGVGAVGGGDLIGGLYPEGTGAGAGHGILPTCRAIVKGLALGSTGNVLTVLLENMGNDDFGYAAVSGYAGVHGSLGTGN